MATINRAPWTALVDDSGQNLDGSIWNKAAIKGVLLDPIDVALGQLYRGNGVYSGTAENTLIIVPVSGLTTLDTLHVSLTLHQNAAAGSVLNLYSSGDALLARLDDIGGGSLAAGQAGFWEILIRANPANTLAFNLLITGGVINATTPPIRQRQATMAVNPFTSTWNLQLAGAQAAGGQMFWNLAVDKR